MALERVEVAKGRWRQDRRPESQVRRIDRLVGFRFEQVGQGIDAQAAGQVRVERRDRLAKQDAVVRATRLRGDERAAGGFEVAPAEAIGVERGGEAPGAPAGACGSRTWAIFIARV